MAYTQEDFQEWIFFISDKLDYMTDIFAKENDLNLDFSIEALDALEEWMLAHYSSPQDLINDPRMLDLLTVYIGETYRRRLGGKWFMDLENKKNVFYAMPVLKELTSRKAGYMTPLTNATASLDRRTGTYMSTIFRYKIELSKETDD